MQGHCRWKGRIASSGEKAISNPRPPSRSLKSAKLQPCCCGQSLAQVWPLQFVCDLGPLLPGGQLTGLIALAGPLPCWWFCAQSVHYAAYVFLWVESNCVTTKEISSLVSWEILLCLDRAVFKFINLSVVIPHSKWRINHALNIQIN